MTDFAKAIKKHVIAIYMSLEYDSAPKMVQAIYDLGHMLQMEYPALSYEDLQKQIKKDSSICNPSGRMCKP